MLFNRDGYGPDGRRRHFFDMGGSSPPPPDYTPVAQASKEAAQIMSDLGMEQLAESKRQYDTNLQIAQPVVQAQLDTMYQTKDQGADYFNYMKANQRPVESALNADAMKDTSAADAAERALITGGKRGIEDRYGADIQHDVGQATADARAGQTAAMLSAIRQGVRFGVAPQSTTALTVDNAQKIASAANSARNASIDKYRALASEGRNLRIADDSRSFAKKIDVAGLYRGLPGASQGAYSLANQSGNSAVANQMAPGQALTAGNAQAADTIGRGQQLRLTGLGSVLNAQTSYANAVANQGSALGDLGSLLGAGVGAYKLIP